MIITIRKIFIYWNLPFWTINSHSRSWVVSIKITVLTPLNEKIILHIIHNDHGNSLVKCGHQEVSRCRTSGKIWGIQCAEVTKHAMRESTLALKPRADVTRSPKQGYQWSHKKDLCSPIFFWKILFLNILFLSVETLAFGLKNVRWKSMRHSRLLSNGIV